VNSKIEIGGVTHSGKQYQIPYDKFEQYLNGIDPKKMKLMSALDVARKCFEFGFMYNTLDLEDYKARVVYLNEQNLKWFNRADSQEKELVKLRLKLAELGVVSLEEPAQESTTSNVSSSESSQLSFEEFGSSQKKPEVSEDLQTSTDAIKESTLN
jgi:hypothetical protein